MLHSVKYSMIRTTFKFEKKPEHLPFWEYDPRLSMYVKYKGP